MSTKTVVLQVINSNAFSGANYVVKGIMESKIDDFQFIYYALKNKPNKLEIAADNVYTADSSSVLSVRPIFDLIKIVRSNNVAVLHCHGTPKVLMIGMILKSLYPKLKLVIHEHGQVMGSENGSKLSTLIYKLLLRLSKHFAFKYVAVSQITKTEILNCIGQNSLNVEVLCNFVDLNRFSPELVSSDATTDFKSKLGLSNENFVVGFVGRLVQVKGWLELIEAVSKLSLALPELRVLIAGDGVDKLRLTEKLAEYSLTDKVILLGYQSDIPGFMKALNCLIVPSYWENLSLTILEAQAMNIPVIATSAGGTPEIIQDKVTGLLVSPRDSDAIAKAIKLLASDSVLGSTISTNAKLAVKNYSLTNFRLNITSCYE